MLNWLKRVRLQSICPHEWHIVSQSRRFINYKMCDFAVVYCPLCEKTRENTLEKANQLIKQQEIKEQYAKNFKL